MEDLLKIAREKYPVGTKFLSAYSGCLCVSDGTMKIGTGTCCIVTGGNSVYEDGRWAEIISDNMYKGQLEGFPPEIVEKMLYYQEKQGNKRDVTVFEKCKDVYSSGFCWDSTDEKFDFWDNVINNKNFDLFFEKYPKQDIVCGVKLEQGKDYCFICKDGTVWLLRFCKIFNNEIYDLGAVNDGEYYNEEISWGGIKNIKSIRPATSEESEHLESCIKAGKYVDMKTYQYEVVHCETQEQWDFVLNKLNCAFIKKENWKRYGKNSGISFNNEQWCKIDWYKEHNSLILSFQEWCDKFGYTFKEEFKVGDWVCAKGTGHTKDNEHFPKDLAWKIANITEYKGTYHAYVDKENNPNNISGRTTNIIDIRKALPHEIPKSLNPCQEIILPNSSQEVMSFKALDVELIKGEIPLKQGLIVNIIEPKQVKQEVKLEPIKLNNHSRLKLK